VLVLGRTEDAELKGLSLAASVMRRVADGSFPSVEFLVRGVPPGEELQLEATLRSSYPKPRRLTTRVFDPRRATAAADIASCNLILQPSLEEGFGLVALEALAIGTPVLVTDRSGVARLLTGAAPELAHHFVAKSGDEAAWTDAVHAVLSDQAGAEQRTLAMAEAIRRRSSWDRAAQDLVDLALQRAPKHRLVQAPDLSRQLYDASTPLRRIQRTTTDGHWISRDEQASIHNWLKNPGTGKGEDYLLLVGAPGTGKSALFSQLVEACERDRLPVLGIKADFLSADVDSADALRARLQLAQSVLATLKEAAAIYGSALLLIDQLDALCEVVDSRTARLNVLVKLLRDAGEIEGVRVAASIRPFELCHEARLRSIHARAKVIDLPLLTVPQMRSALGPTTVPDTVDPTLCTPHALDLLVESRRLQGPAFSFPASIGQLRTRYWRSTVLGPEEEAACRSLATRLAETGALWVPRERLTDVASSLASLEMRGVIRTTPDGSSLGFRHQTLFDFARARDLLEAGRFPQFVEEHASRLEIRPLVRSVLLHLRADNRQQYDQVVETLWTSSLPLHLRLLLVDCISDTPTPTPKDVRWFARAVADASVRRRALGGISRRSGWFDALATYLVSWMSSYPQEVGPLVAAVMSVDSALAIDAIRRLWLSTSDGKGRVLNVLARQQRIPPPLDDLVMELVPEIIRSRPYVIPQIGAAIQRDDAQRAALFYSRCIVAERQHRAVDAPRSQPLTAVDLLLSVGAEPEAVLDILEPIAPPMQEHYWHELTSALHDSSYERAVEQMLMMLGKKNPAALVARAHTRARESALAWFYIQALQGVEGEVSGRLEWLLASNRLEMAPEAGRLIRALAPSLDKDAVLRVEAKIAEAELYPRMRDRDGAPEPAGWRRDAERANRAYRLYLRDQLPATQREPGSLRSDQRERRQLEGHAHVPEPRSWSGPVRSPMSAQQIAQATDAAVLNALEQDDDGFRFDENHLAVGGAREVLAEIRRLAETDPERAMGLAIELRDRGRVQEARGLLFSLAQHHASAPAVEGLAVSLMCEDKKPLVDDDECAWAFEILAGRALLSSDALVRIQARFENAAENTPSKPSRQASSDRRKANTRGSVLFCDGGPANSPGGTYRWLEVLDSHFRATRRPNPALWANAIRCALRVDRNVDTWSCALADFEASWGDWGGEEATRLLTEIVDGVGGEDILAAASRVVAWMRNRGDSDLVRAWVSRLEKSGLHVVAAELVCLSGTDAGAEWPAHRLDVWRSGEHAVQYGRGILAASAALFGDPSRRDRLASLISDWADRFDVHDLALLFDRRRDEAWYDDHHAVGVLQALLPRVGEWDIDVARGFVWLLGAFLERPALVLEYVDGLLTCCTNHPESSDFIVAECLALTFSLRMALPAETERIHSLFERALAADVPAAEEILETLDGQPVPAWRLSMNVHLRQSAARLRIRRR
jgi:hypothetical protein